VTETLLNDKAEIAGLEKLTQKDFEEYFKTRTVDARKEK